MLLRNIAVLLLIANLTYAAYSEGWLHIVTGWDASQREPERLKKQVNADAITVEKIAGSASNTEAAQIDSRINTNSGGAATPASKKSEINNQPLQAVSPIAEPKEPSTKICVKGSQDSAEQWVIYMGPFATQDLLVSKKAELAKLGVSSTEISKSSLPRGLSLGKFKTEQQAQTTLGLLQKKGIKTAKLLLWSKEVPPPKCN
jgi:cell division protein FtsN